MSTENARPNAPVDRIIIWHVGLNDGDWYKVFATSGNGAVKLVCEHHYDDLTRGGFVATYRPSVRRIGDAEQVTVVTEDGEQTKAAREWCQGEPIGLFCSNTYEI